MDQDPFPPLTVGQLIERLRDVNPDLPITMNIEVMRGEPGSGIIYLHTATVRHVMFHGGLPPHTLDMQLEGRAGV